MKDTASARSLGSALLVLGLLTVLAGETAWAQITFQTNRILQVSTSNTRALNCQGLRNVLAGINDAGPTKRYLVRIEPGELECGSTPVIVPGWVTLQGSGEELTIIKGTVDAFLLGVIHLSSDTVLRELTVENNVEEALNGGIAVSISDFGSTANNVELDEVRLYGQDGSPKPYSLLGVDAYFVVWRSVLGTVSLTSGTAASFKYSQIIGLLTSNATASCQYCYGLFAPLSWGCQYLDPPDNHSHPEP